jgi:hypothetical protein
VRVGNWRRRPLNTRSDVLLIQGLARWHDKCIGSLGASQEARAEHERGEDMAQPVSQDWDRDTAFEPGGHRGVSRSEVSDSARRIDSIPPEVTVSERHRNRIWRAMSWVLLANVLLFWLMTCVTAFARAAAA